MTEILIFTSLVALPYVWVIMRGLKSYREKMARHRAGHRRVMTTKIVG